MPPTESASHFYVPISGIRERTLYTGSRLPVLHLGQVGLQTGNLPIAEGVERVHLVLLLFSVQDVEVVTSRTCSYML